MEKTSHENILINAIFEIVQSYSVTLVALVERGSHLKVNSSREMVLLVDALAKHKSLVFKSSQGELGLSLVSFFKFFHSKDASGENMLPAELGLISLASLLITVSKHHTLHPY